MELVMAIRKHRLNPNKVMVLLLYGSYGCVTSASGRVGHLKMKIGEFARLIRVPNSRLREYLEWLNHWEFITDLQLSHGEAVFQVTPPALFMEESDGRTKV